MPDFEITIKSCFQEDKDVETSIIVSALNRENALREFYASPAAKTRSGKAYELYIKELKKS